jgi:TPR repeat protein
VRRKDYFSARKWFTLAAKQGNGYAAYMLFVLLSPTEQGKPYDVLGDFGEVGKREANAKAALKWLKKSAELGSPGGQMALGISYQKGEIVSKDKVRALMWFLVAAQNENQMITGGYFHKTHSMNLAWFLTDSKKEKLSNSKIKKAKKMAQKCIQKDWVGC